MKRSQFLKSLMSVASAGVLPVDIDKIENILSSDGYVVTNLDTISKTPNIVKNVTRIVDESSDVFYEIILNTDL